ncbi:GNAT family N-acetyltransferase [Metasolibacillus meyeri]|uniref:GNAT family N-acetyltransferase n=1 Tax=Metasolibacillus meyeri TaxID=1071052 RepID=UPI000D3109FB|nr:GNAT family N-acetyltransferase [Metasolibacillus meyeri]
MTWTVKEFNELTTTELYQIIQHRVNIFIVEQQSIYEDLDDHDQNSLHILYKEEGRIVAYARLLPPGEKYEEASFGRVVVAKEKRGTGLGKELIAFTMQLAKERWATANIFIQAQNYLAKFYQDFGFEAISEPYDYDNVPHIDMLYTAIDV